MKLSLAFVKSQEFMAWTAINVVFPIFTIGLIRLIDISLMLSISMLANNILAGSSALIILIANIYCAKRWYKTPAFKYFIGIILLNLIGLFVTSSISFITSLAHLNVYFYYVLQLYQIFI